MIALGIIVVEIPSIVGKYPKSLELFNTILVVKMTDGLMKSRLCLVDLHISFTTRIIRSISGMCLLVLVKLTIGPLENSAISSRTGANSPSV